MLDQKDQQTLLSYAVLVGLTPLIPIPLVDDIAKSYFRRQLVRALAANRGCALDVQAVQTLADESGGSGLLGVAGAIVMYPAKKVFRKVFYFLEIKRAVDTLSQTYYHGFLVASALQEGLCAPSGVHQPAAVRAAIDSVLKQTDTSLVSRAARGAFSQSKAALKGAVDILTSRLRSMGGKVPAAEVERAVAETEPQEAKQIEVITKRLQALIGDIPREHFEQLREKLTAALR